MKRRIVCEIDVPEDFDACWNDGCGLNAFSDTILLAVCEIGMEKIIEYHNLGESENERDIQFAQYLKTKQVVRQSLRMIGHLNANGDFVKMWMPTDE